MGTDDDQVSLLVLQPTPFCNIDCSYCYLADRTNHERMALETLSRVISTVVASGRVGEILRICWHSGEPLVVPPGYYEDAFAIIRRLVPDSTKIEYVFQTNGVLIDDRWCGLFRRHPVTVGISLDGPAEVHDRHRRDRAGKGTFDRVLKGIDALRRNGLKFYIIAVLTDRSLDNAKQLFEFFCSLGIEEVCFNVEEVEGIHITPSYSPDRLVERARRFFRAYYQLLRERSFPHWVREFDYAFNAVLRAPLETPRNALTTPFRSLNVDYLGNFSTFCPELLGVHTNAYGPFMLGNLANESIDDCVAREPFISLNRDIRHGVDMCAATCAYFKVCGGGAPSNKLFENGTFRSSETRHCQIFIKTLVDLAIDFIEDNIARQETARADQLTADKENCRCSKSS
ncbi:cyclophane-forming radical SAM/SPASM peptide maturase GrrM/OscB [Bradyrhizobium sp. STM 3809]|uniref:cyclophane-forming radical SAM/SPASM peptide maturase GrrM/OscB n=1 Tax=Bradyrhizobium sp. STM 3809 TaxID=551936 RepID=UPI0002409261|nr:cyclophane-forming radical SAM/SPASM peptide maturase GrrM/OscB [Bradyrhizobium sp. STM 3809]CCE00663.1 putative Radical SAM domain protein [Bradyrhizobium sp. STM 3809]